LQRPDIGAATTAGLAGEAGLQIRQADVIRRGIKSKPACSMKLRQNSLTVPLFDTVKAVLMVVAVSI
jgi:hypothetical protein